MDVFSAYSAINRAVIKSIEAVNILTVPEEPKKQSYLRLEDNPFVLTDDVAVTCQVVTAHNINQYKNKYYSIKLEENVHSWLQDLLAIDEKEKE